MELMSEKDKELNIPKAIVFDAKSGASINWFKEIGIHKLINILKNKNYEYHVIFNLGVNDLSEKIDIDKRVNEYYKLYKRIYISNEGVYFYFLSVNPVDDSIIKNENRSNKNIRLFNTKMKSKLDNLNIKYCDSYNNLKFDLPDGLHYDTNTDKKILYYIINDCVSLF